jgi:hypothetical protein
LEVVFEFAHYDFGGVLDGLFLAAEVGLAVFGGVEDDLMADFVGLLHQ